ncbi:DUF3159 domain-containing protein [Gryllotalpicola sp.]|uniref:DUF3159 domain-containing protein n=1 Tax=Gryllotalpicola sp. TaxID=1932787 RepID=UPI0026252049|nr:DUF3159 domain-containing protein [Gryllotalpicola sp.]
MSDKLGGYRALADQDHLDGRAVLMAMGGVRGLCEAVLPGLVFIVAYTILLATPLTAQAVPISLGASVLIALVFTVLRIAGRTPVSQAIGGLIGVGASAILAIVSNRPTDNFLIGLGIDALFGVVFLVSTLVRWPIIGLAVGYLMGDGTLWRTERAKYRILRLATLVWIGMFAARLAVQVPLFLANDLTGLAVAHLVMGVPLYVPVLLVTWLLVRPLYPRKDPAEEDSDG